MTNCLEASTRMNKNYGIASDGELMHRKTIRLAGEDQFGVAWDPGLVVMHICDNPPCFRYDHLRLGTIADNQADMAAKGRARGDRNLTEVEVLQIRQMRAEGRTLDAIAESFDLSRVSAARVSQGRTYKEMGGPITPPGAMVAKGRRNIDCPEIRAAIKGALRAGRSLRSVALTHGVSVPGIRYINNKMKESA